MASVRSINKNLNKTFDGKVEAYVEDGCLILSGELERWNDVVRAGLIAARLKPGLGIVNNIACSAETAMKPREPGVEDSHLEWEEPDVLIIGGGVIGCAIARELSAYNLDVLLVEKEYDVALQASGRNTGIIHSGAGMRRGTLKQYYALMGSQRIYDTCADLSVPVRRTGQLLAYTSRLWKPFLFISNIYWKLCGVKGGRVANAQALHNLEPAVANSVGSALHFGGGGIVDPHALTVAYAENALSNGARISLNTIVRDMEVEDGVIKKVITNRGTIIPKAVVNAAGIFCDEIAKMAGDQFYSLHPVKGTCAVIDKRFADEHVSSSVSIYGKISAGKRRRSKLAMSDNFSGVSRATIGSVLSGPFYNETIHKEDFSTDVRSVELSIDIGRNVAPMLDITQVLRAFAGICATTYEGDFIVSRGRMVSNLVHTAGISSPGLTASPAIAEDAVRLVRDILSETISITKKTAFNPKREPLPVLRNMEAGAREQLIENNPDYGIIVCQCEQISKGEIVDAIKREIVSDTVDGIKRRVHTCCGTCQGQHCAPLIHKIISDERLIAFHQVRKNGRRSEITVGNWSALLNKQYDAMPEKEV